MKPNEHILNSTARSFISSNSISRGEAISQSHSGMEDSNYYPNDANPNNNNRITPIKNKTGLDLLLLKQFNEKLPEQIFYNTNNPHNLSQIDQTEEYEDEMSSGFGNSFNNNAKEVEINSNKREYLQKLYESKEYNDLKSNIINSIKPSHNYQQGDGNEDDEMSFNSHNNNVSGQRQNLPITSISFGTSPQFNKNNSSK